MEYDILTTETISSTIKAEVGVVSSNKDLHIVKNGVRRFENNKLFQTTRLGKVSDERLIMDTKEWGGPGISHNFGFAPAIVESRDAKDINNQVFEQFQEGLSRLTQDFSDFVFSGSCMLQNITTKLRSSYGVDLTTSGSLCEWYYLYKRKGSANMLDGYFGSLGAKLDIDKEIEEHSEFLRVQGQEKQLAAGSMPVIFVEGEQVLAKLIQSFRVNTYEEGAALYSGKLGQKLFSDKISIVDSAYDSEYGHFSFFDGEGVVRNENLKLINQGVFENLICDLRFGKKYNRSSTGNGMRPTGQGVTLAPRTLRIGPGQKSWREIIKKFDRCLVAMVAAGGDSNDLGEFSSPVQIGYIVENGKVVAQAPQVTVKTNLTDYLGKKLIDVSSDGFTVGSPAGCIISEIEVLIN
jgi:PmbA protein